MKKEIIFLLIIVIGVCLICGCSTTPQPPSTAEPTSAMKTVLYSDDLSQLRSEWQSEYDDTDGKIFYSGGSLHIRDNDPPGVNRVKMVYTLNKNFNDFILDVDTKLIAGPVKNWQGVDLRLQDDNYYGVQISADGKYSIYKVEKGNLISLIGGPTQSSYISTGIGATNHIHIEANKNTLSLSVNGHQIRNVTDNAFKEGTVELSSTCLTSNSFNEVAFSNLVITTI
jgi:hypothetical protein